MSKQVYQHTNVAQEHHVYRNYHCYPNHNSKGFTGWWNPNHATTTPIKSTSTGETQTSPPKDKPHRHVGQGQLDCNQESQPASATSNQGKKTKKLNTEAPPHPGPSIGPSAGPRNDFTLRNLGTGRPTIQCTACNENSHRRRECPYDNYCTTCDRYCVPEFPSLKCNL